MQDENRLFADFGLEDLAEGENNPVWGIAMSIFGFVVWALLAWTTAEFFGLYASAFGVRFGENASMFVAAVGIVLIDVGYVAWVLLGVKKANSTGQLSVALGAGIILFLISLLSTLVYTTLNSAFSGEIVDASTRQQLAIAGQLVITGALAVNGIASFLWLVLSNAWKRSRHIAGIRSIIYSKRHSIDAERAERVTTSTVKNIRDGMQGGAAQLGSAKSGEYLQRGHMAQPVMSNDQPSVIPLGQPQGAARRGIGFAAKRPTPSAPKNEPTLYAVFADGKQITAPTTEADALARANEQRKGYADWAERSFSSGGIISHQPEITVRPIKAAAKDA